MIRVLTHIIIFNVWIISAKSAKSQIVTSLDDVIKLAHAYSIDYQENIIRFLDNYLSYRQYKLSQLPKVTLNAIPITINRSLTDRYDFQNNTEVFRESEMLNSKADISISEKIALTGGYISFHSSFSRIENFGESNLISFNTNLFRITYTQPLFAFNPNRWEKLENSIELKLAKALLVQSEQKINQKVVKLYFNLLKANQMFELAQLELSNSDTLLNIGIKLLELKNITPNELSDLKLKNINARISIVKSEQGIINAQFEMDHFINDPLSRSIKPIFNESFPELSINTDDLLMLARNLNPLYYEIEQERINLKKNFEQEKKQNKFNANLSFSYGLNQGGNTFLESLSHPIKQQTGSLSLSIPLFNWGEKRDKLLVTEKNMEMSELKMDSRVQDFERAIQNKFLEFNLNKNLIQNLVNAVDLAFNIYNTKVKLYTIGRINLQELNQAKVELYDTKEIYLESIAQLWSNYYELQEMLLYDLKTNQPLTIDFENLINIFKD